MKTPYLVLTLVVVVIVAFGIMRLIAPPGENDPLPTVSDAAIEDALRTMEEGYTGIDQEQQSTMQDNNTQQNAETAPQDASSDATVVLRTNKGDIEVQLYLRDLPVTAGNFLKLAQDNFYDGVKFHRVIDGFMIQGGDPLTKDDTQKARWGTGGPGYAIPDEFGPRHSNARGTLSMANAGPNTGGSQFFVNTTDNTFLDGKHPVFGKVISGMEVVDLISSVETGPGDVPVEAVVITDVVIK